MRRISKRVREEAIEACLLLAEESRKAIGDRYARFGHVPVCNLYDDDWIALAEAGSLALSAWGVVFRAVGPILGEAAYCPETYLEAAALLRDGWNVGDPVEVRR